MKLNKSNISTILGLVVAIANAWVNVDWTDFEFNAKHIMPLVVSALIALGGWMTEINIKSKSNKYEGKL